MIQREIGNGPNKDTEKPDHRPDLDGADCLESHGFTVMIIDERNFALEIVQKHVLFPPVLSNHPLATNHRKLYFAQKASV